MKFIVLLPELEPVIEAEVHQRLRAFLREQGESQWPHHLTMARLVARALRLGRSALIQAGSSSAYHGRYRLSYLMSVLLWPGAAILVAPEAIHQRILMVDIPRLRHWLPALKPIQVGDRWPHPHFDGLLITSPQAWLSDRLRQEGRFPPGIMTLLDGVDDLETWVRDVLTIAIGGMEWESLMQAFPLQQELIRDSRVRLTHNIFRHPDNPYNCHLLDGDDQAIVHDLFTSLKAHDPDQDHFQAVLPLVWSRFWDQFRQNSMVWANTHRQQGQWTLHCGPIGVAEPLSPIWQQQPLVLIGAALDLDSQASTFCQRLGLTHVALTQLKFALDRHQDLIHLYLPDHLPLPNTHQFQSALMQELETLILKAAPAQGLTVVLVNDMPLKNQVGSMLAAQFGSRVQVEKTCLDDNGIVIGGWNFWRQHQGVLPAPCLLIMATLPIPSLEDPLVAGRVAYYKQKRQDWFRLYLLPETLSEIQRAIAPVREVQGTVALLDTRVNHRSYGRQILSALSPSARSNYIDMNWFDPSGYAVLDRP